VLKAAMAGVGSLFDRGFDPATARRLPVVDASGASNVRGLFLVGEIAGTPLIKLGLNRGRDVIDRLHAERAAGGDGGWDPGADRDAAWHDVLIIGAGSSGLGAADRCQELGLDYVVIEQQRPAQLIRDFTRGKPLYMEPPDEENRTRLFCEECVKEELLERWDRQLEELGIAPNIRTFETVEDVQRLGDRDGFRVTTDRSTCHARRVVLAIGMAGNPRHLDVPGEREHADRISQNLADPDAFRDRDVVVFGAGDVACEAAVALADGGNRVTMVAPDRELTFPRARNKEAVLDRAERAAIDLRLGHRAAAIGAAEVVIRSDDTGAQATVAADHVFRCIGADLPLGFLKRVGVRLEGSWHFRRWMILLVAFLVSYFIYGAKASPALWPFDLRSDLFGGRSFADWWAGLHVGSGTWAFKINGSFWYSLAYCVVMTVFGMKAYYRWGVRHDDAYQRKRFATLIIVQWTLAFLVPNVLMWWLHGVFGDNPVLGSRDRWWHASGFEYAFPLFFWQFFWDVGWLYLVYGLAATFIIIPLTTIRHGKRYCTWFCGCGGLAETLGDPWRHLAPKGRVAGRWEWMNAAVLVWAVVAAGLVIAKVGLGQWITGEPFMEPVAHDVLDDAGGLVQAGSGVLTTKLFHGYKVIADVWLVGIIPIALYPILGGKIWCRYWCPLAKWMQMTSRWFGSLQISSNDKCITCGECSRYCEVGIDVMSFAKSQAPFHNENTSCIQCGICITVCPMDVLSFDNDRRRGVALTVEGREPVG
jgi:thioredoxin reductase/polyferredoxin